MSAMNVYIAAPFVCKDEARKAREVLARFGIVSVAHWIDIEEDETDVSFERLKTEALQDYRDMLAADALVILNLKQSEGKAVETGMAITLEIPIILVGERTNVFHYLPDVRVVPTIEQAVEVLGEFLQD